MKASFLNKIKKDLKNSKKLKDSFYFLFYFLISFIAVYFFLSKTILYNFINYFFGAISTKLLNLVYSIPATFYFNSVEKITYIFIPSIEFPVAIVFLCTGILEFALIFSAIISSYNVSLKKRFFWIFLSSIIIIIFNIFRITFTIFLINILDLKIADFFHGFLFRLFLILVVIGTYYFFIK
jgi:exosortase/archaeosortase family protein